MFKLFSVFLFAATASFAQAQFLKCEGTANAAPFVIMINASEPELFSVILNGSDADAAFRRSDYVHFELAEMKGETEDCLISAANEEGSFSIKMPACQLQAGSTVAAVSAPQFSIEASEVWLQCSWVAGDDA